MADTTVPITAGSGTPIRVLTALGAGSGGQQVFTLADSAGNLLGASSAPFPVNISSSASNIAVASGSLTAAGADTPGTAQTASTTGQVVLPSISAGNATFHLLATAFVGTVVFEASVNGGVNYAQVMCIREDGSGSETTTAISTAAAFIRTYTVGLPGFTHFRVRASAFTSGTLSVYLSPGAFLVETNPSLAASSAVIGTALARAADLAISTTGAASAAVTATLPAAGAGLFHYITLIEIQRYASVALVGAAAPVVVTSTNLPGSLAWSVDTAGAVGTSQVQIVNPALPIKSSAANTATTIVAPVYTNAIWRINVHYYTGT